MIPELERRWAAIRQEMARGRLDTALVIATGQEALAADYRYLTGRPPSRRSLALLTPEGPPIAISDRAHAAEHGVEEIHGLSERWREMVAAELQRRLASARRVGVVGLGTDRATERRELPPSVVRLLPYWLPGARLVPFTAPLRRVRARKSEAELALLRQAAATADSAFGVIRATLRHGIKELEAWAAAAEVLARAGSEVGAPMRWGSGLWPDLLPRPTHGELLRGHVVLAEIDASMEGYRASGTQALAIETADPLLVDLYARLEDYCRMALPLIRPGGRSDRLAGRAQKLAERQFARVDRFEDVHGEIRVHGVGLGGDPPTTDRLLGVRIEPGWTVGLEIGLSARAHGRRYRALWGDAFLVGADRLCQLGSRQPGSLLVAPVSC